MSFSRLDETPPYGWTTFHVVCPLADADSVWLFHLRAEEQSRWRRLSARTMWTCLHLSTAHPTQQALPRRNRSPPSLVASRVRFSPLTTTRGNGAMWQGLIPRADNLGPSAGRGAGQQHPEARAGPQLQVVSPSCTAAGLALRGTCPLLWRHSPAGSLQAGRTSTQRSNGIPHTMDGDLVPEAECMQLRANPAPHTQGPLRRGAAAHEHPPTATICP